MMEVQHMVLHLLCYFQEFLLKLKGIVHSKMKILSLITHPLVVPNP